MKFSIASWNVLADSYTSFGTKPVPAASLWEYRSAIISERLQQMQADIFTLQEVDHFDDFYCPLFNSLGYDTAYLQRPEKPDGSLIPSVTYYTLYITYIPYTPYTPYTPYITYTSIR